MTADQMAAALWPDVPVGSAAAGDAGSGLLAAGVAAQRGDNRVNEGSIDLAPLAAPADVATAAGWPAWIAAGVLFAVLLSLTVAVWRACLRDDDPQRGLPPPLVLVAGLIGSGALAACFLQLLRDRTARAAQARGHVEALQLLNEIAAGITARPQAGPRALEELADVARRLLTMDRAGVLVLLAPANDTLELLAWAGDMPPAPRRLYPIDELPACRDAMSGGEVCFVADAADAAGDEDADDRTADVARPRINTGMARAFGARGTALIPLLVEGRPIGVLTLSASRPRRFTDGQRQLARLLGAHAAVILANNRLYERMRAALHAQTRLARQRDALWAVHARADEAESLQETLERIVNLAPGALGADACVAHLATGRPDELVISATTGEALRDLIGVPLNVRETRGGEVLRTGQWAMVSDAAEDATVNPTFAARLRARSVLYLPLARSGGGGGGGGENGGAPAGLLVLTRHQAGGFTPQQVELAKVFSARAAAAVESARLREQAYRDAETKDMLLRELNHRVKNNLAGIVALLSIGEPEMGEVARQWLGRVVDRVRLMAGAHELFSGGVRTVGLEDLVARTLASLSVARPPGVEIRTELDAAAPLALGTDKAVGLAMALHELCFNALLHGLGPQGTLTIRAHDGERIGDLAIDVIDDGRGLHADHRAGQPDRPATRGLSDTEPTGCADLPEFELADPAESSRGTGIGLTLVEGIVSRELKGRFSLRPHSTGGTIATIELPVTTPAARVA